MEEEKEEKYELKKKELDLDKAYSCSMGDKEKNDLAHHLFEIHILRR